MEPFSTAAVLFYVAKKFGDHYLPKILDAADRKIMDEVGRDKESPDIGKVEQYLKQNPEAAQKVEQQLVKLQIKGVVLPPEGTQLLPADRLVVFAGVMNAVLSVMKQQKRDFATDGFFNSEEAIAVFQVRSTMDDPGSVVVANKAISCNLAFTEIYLFQKSEVPSAAEINEALRNAAASSTSFVNIKGIKRLKSLQQKCTLDNQVVAIHPDFVEVMGPKDPFGRTKVLRTSEDLDELSPEMAAFLKLSNPYKATVRMLDYLASEFDKFFLSADEVKQLRDLALRLAPGARNGGGPAPG